MDARESHASGLGTRLAALLTRLIAWTLAIIGVLSGVALVPILASVVYQSQKGALPSPASSAVFAAISALLATLALGVISGSLMVQWSNLKREERREMDRELIELIDKIRENPEYGQCWGSRVSPDHIPEHLFHYTSRIVSYWAKSWRYGRLRDKLARTYAREFFKSAIPRMYWERYGTWHKPRRGIRRLVTILDEEYLAAVKAGEPQRPYMAPHEICNENRTKTDSYSRHRIAWQINTRQRAHTLRAKRSYSDPNSSTFTAATNSRQPSDPTKIAEPGT